jgi:predicted metal-dependent hydrolase
MKFEYGTETIEFTVEYRKRKSFRISVEPPDSVFVVAPVGIKDDEILKMVKTKARWIIKKLCEIKESGMKKRDKDYADGEIFMYLGRDLRLTVQSDENVKQPLVELVECCLLVRTVTEDPDKLRKPIEDWYRKRSLEIVSERVGNYQKHFEQRPIDIRSKRQKSRWGSCSNAHRLNFNLRCVMAPLEVIDYIVVHEMCHMVHFNHSKEFWGLVETILPDFKERRAWLKKNGIRMNL